MANIITILPELKIYSHDFDKFYETIQIAERQFSCTVPLPPNETDKKIVYTFEAYTNGEPTGIITTITSHPSADIEYAEIESFWAENYDVPGTGGDVTMYISFDSANLPSVKIVEAINELSKRIDNISNIINMPGSGINALLSTRTSTFNYDASTLDMGFVLFKYKGIGVVNDIQIQSEFPIDTNIYIDGRLIDRKHDKSLHFRESILIEFAGILGKITYDKPFTPSGLVSLFISYDII